MEGNCIVVQLSGVAHAFRSYLPFIKGNISLATLAIGIGRIKLEHRHF